MLNSRRASSRASALTSASAAVSSMNPELPADARRTTSSANCSSSRVCVAVTIVRTRALSRATVGNPMPCAKTPFANSRSDSFIASAPSPTMTGVIGLSLMPVLKPRSRRPALKNRVFSHSRSMSSRLLEQHVDRRDARGGHRRRMRGREQKRPGAVIEKLDQRAAAGDVSAQRADRLRQRADLDVDAAVHAEVIDGAAAVPAEHAARMRIVDHHDAAEFLGERAQLRQRAEVAVHAEHAVGDQQLALRRRQPRAGSARAASTSLCGNTLIVARLRRQPSMMLA